MVALSFVIVVVLAIAGVWLCWFPPQKEGRDRVYTEDRQHREIEFQIARLARRRREERCPMAPGMAHEAVEPSGAAAFDMYDTSVVVPMRRQ